jgi:hypothetical protein
MTAIATTLAIETAEAAAGAANSIMHVRFPDARIEYEDRDGRSRHEDLEVVTGHYRGAHAGSAARSGFTCYLSTGCSVGGRGGRRTAHPRLIEELLR